MSTATKARPKTSALVELERLEEAWGEATKNTRALGHTHREKQDATRALIDLRDRLLRRDPGQFNPDGSPREQDSEAARVHADIDALGQYDFRVEIAHAERLESAAKNQAYAHIADNLTAILEAIQADAAAAVAAVQEKAVALADAADAYLGLAKRVDGLRAADRTLQQVRVPAVESGAELVRLTAGYRDEALPLPTDLRYPGQP